MIAMEIIHLRSNGPSLADLTESIRTSLADLADLADPLGVATVYRKSGLDTDIAIHIHHRAPRAPEKSAVGQRLAAELRRFGLVEHSVWEEL